MSIWRSSLGDLEALPWLGRTRHEGRDVTTLCPSFQRRLRNRNAMHTGEIFEGKRFLLGKFASTRHTGGSTRRNARRSSQRALYVNQIAISLARSLPRRGEAGSLAGSSSCQRDHAYDGRTCVHVSVRARVCVRE